MRGPCVHATQAILCKPDTTPPALQRLMMARTPGGRQSITAPVTVMTLLTLTGGFGLIKAALDGLCGRTRWTRDAVWPAQRTNDLITNGVSRLQTNKR